MKNKQSDIVLAFKKANREIENERNGGHWIAIDKPHRNKKKYYRNNNKKELSKLIDSSLSYNEYYFL